MWLRMALEQERCPAAIAADRVQSAFHHVWRHAGRRKINTRVGRDAVRERVRHLVGEHDDQLVTLIWGGRILGWSLR